MDTNGDIKMLLFNDLCSRLPYHVRVKVWLKDGTTEEGVLDLEHNYGDVLRDAFYYNKIKDIKPYLRPLSSMTNEEKKEVSILLNREFYIDDDYALVAEDNRHRIRLDLMHIYIKWLYAHHFDVDDLIPTGLAIEVTKENNPYNS